MTSDDQFRERVKKLHAQLGSTNLNEREAARRKLDELLEQKKKTWNDLPELLSSDRNNEGFHRTDNPPDDDGPSDVPGPLNLACQLDTRYLHLTRHQCIALALWIIHTHVFDRFTTTPRLTLRSPVRGCGKTTTLLVVKELAAKARRVDHITAAAIFRIIDFDRPTLLLDEGDNLDLVHSPTL